MCGIIGYKGPKNAVNIVLEGLKSLEYRGYDSWGIAAKSNSKIIVEKKEGKLGNATLDLDSNFAMGHTRWATHGEAVAKNAHPHLSNDGNIAVAHNGIIENYQAQREFLTKQGFTFKSDTDTEVIPITIEYHMQKGYNFIEAAKRSLKHLEGQYAIVAFHADEDSLIAIRREAPLVLGIGDKEFFVASDIPAFLKYTRRVIFLEDQDLAIINSDLKIFNLAKDIPVKREISTIEWSPEQAQKGKFDHFFLKEISEQAEVVSRATAIDTKQIENIVKEIKEAKGIYFVACGSAAHACMHGLYLFSKIAKVHVNFCIASEFPYFQHFIVPESLVIAISQSGETADTLAAIRAAKEHGAKVISIVNVMGSTLVRESDRSILQGAGPEICVLSTKAYTSQLAILTLLAYALANKFEDGKAMIKELMRHIYYLTSENTRRFVRRLAEKLRYAPSIYLIGRGLQYPTALEAALKIKEVSYIHAEAYAGGELKHGSIALIEHGTPCIVFTSSETEKDIINNAVELKSRGAYIIGIGPKNNMVFDFYIKVRDAGEFNPLIQIIPIQILAYQLALLRGCDPDMPRNLAKSVTVK